jgi:hypothetical protein
MPRLSKIGAAALAAFGWTGLQAVDASYLVVAGGGGGGGQYYAGGGGAGGYLTGTTSLNPTQSYTVTVGAGGASVSARGSSGTNSQFGTLTAAVGGGGGGANSTSGQQDGATGGSGGGGSSFGTATTGTGGSGTSGQGNAGGTGNVGSGSNVQAAGGGGGGASAVGANASVAVGGNGGAGTASSISGSSVTYAGGGGGGVESGTAGTGGSGGGGNGQLGTGTAAAAGTANTGGGGGGSGYNASGGQGGSGVVIISYVGAQQFGGGIVTSSGGSTIHTFQTSGTLSPLSSLTANFLVIAGGGGGGGTSAGGGAGGYRTSAGTSGGGASAESTLTIDTNSIYLVTVGAGGAPGATTGVSGANGTNSAFLNITSIGGGYGSGNTGGTAAIGGTGGSGGGSHRSAANGGVAGAGTAGQGFAGGLGADGVFVYTAAGGGGGAAQVGATTSNTTGAAGGNGVASSITGTSVTRAGGGGGGTNSSGALGGSGGSGGGGKGSDANTYNATAGEANTGGGGGGAQGNVNGTAQAGGSGIVIISYAGATQLMAGGTVTISGGNVIHTFTSSGYLTPLTLVDNSLRFRASNNNYLARTYGTPTNNKVWTWSAWVKRGSLSLADANHLFMGSLENVTGNPSVYTRLVFETDNTLRLQSNGSAGELFTSSAVYRDPAAWYHIVLSMNASSTVVNCFVNGTEIAYASRTNPTNTDTAINRASYFHRMGFFRDAEPRPFDGYMTDINFIDGQALTPNSFGTFNSYGVWQPITYGGSYGNNGFYLPFTNKTSTTTLGYDFSPQSNNWTPNNISLGGPAVIQSFTSTGTTSWTAPAGVYGATYLVVAGGGSGGGYVGGGGGAGGLLTGTLAVTPGSSYTVTVGAGGTAVTGTARGNSGGNSVFDTVTATGGGGGGARNGTTAGISGGSGGGGAFNAGAGGTGTSGQGFAGAANNGANGSASGGGGASAVGGTNATNGGAGGAGTASSISGSSVTYAGGGGGGTDAGSGGSGGAGGGGAGASTSGSGTAGTPNTGGGGGGAGSAGGAATSGAGGSGIVIISYLNPASSTYDSMTDVPTLTSATAANYPTLNPLNASTTAAANNANLQAYSTSGANTGAAGINCTMAFPTTGLYYFEVTMSAVSNAGVAGMAKLGATQDTNFGAGAYANIYGYTNTSGVAYANNATAYTGSTLTTGDILGVAVDMTNGALYFAKNNTWQNSGVPTSGASKTGAISFTVTNDLLPACYAWKNSGADALSINFGQRPFTYTAPTGYVALNTFNL